MSYEGTPMQATNELGPEDVALGRGTGPNEHIGNRKYRAEIFAHKDAYQHGTRAERNAIIKRIIAGVKARDGRFLKRSDRKSDGVKHDGERGEALYEVATDKAVAEKTRQAFRYMKGVGQSIDPTRTTVDLSQPTESLRALTRMVKRENANQAATNETTSSSFLPNPPNIPDLSKSVSVPSTVQGTRMHVPSTPNIPSTHPVAQAISQLSDTDKAAFLMVLQLCGITIESLPQILEQLGSIQPQSQLQQLSRVLPPIAVPSQPTSVPWRTTNQPYNDNAALINAAMQLLGNSGSGQTLPSPEAILALMQMQNQSPLTSSPTHTPRQLHQLSTPNRIASGPGVSSSNDMNLNGLANLADLVSHFQGQNRTTGN